MWQQEEVSSIEEKIAIIGGGWFGCETAKSVKLENPRSQVILFEKNTDIFSGISGKFGSRLHAGPHYPRSLLTRKLCHEGYQEFYDTYPELINEHSYSIYGLGITDANDEPSKVSKEEFVAVCKEFGRAEELSLDTNEYCNLTYAVNIKEPSLVMGKRLREFFKEQLKNVGVELRCNFQVKNIEKSDNDKFYIQNEEGEIFDFDRVINATSYQALLPLKPLDLSLNIKIFYQPCIGLVYEHCLPIPEPFSFIVMDGAFPSLVPHDDRSNTSEVISKYVLTHAKWSTLERFESLQEAEHRLSSIDTNFIDNEIKPKCESEINKYWPAFKEKLRFITWIAVILAKTATSDDSRAAIAFQEINEEQKKGMIHIIPGKVSNSRKLAREVVSLIKGKDVVIDGDYCYAKGGVLDRTKHNLTSFPATNFFKKSSYSDESQITEPKKSLPKIPPRKLSFLKQAEDLENEQLLSMINVHKVITRRATMH